MRRHLPDASSMVMFKSFLHRSVLLELFAIRSRYGLIERIPLFRNCYFQRSWLIMELMSMSGMTKMSLLGIGLVIFSILSISWGSENFYISQKGSPMATKAINEVLKEHSKAIMSMPGVAGTGQGLCEGKPCIKVFVIKKTPDLEEKIPKTLEGYPVVIAETGTVKALPRNVD